MKPSDQRGMILTIVILVGAAFSIMSLAIAQFSLAHFTTARRGVIQLDALALAEAGADDFMYNINQSSSYGSTCPTYSAPTTLHNDAVKGKGTYETCVQNGSISGEKIVFSIGKIYLPTTAAAPASTRKIKIVIINSTPSIYAIQTGPGGLILGNNVIIGNGEVYVNGRITMGNNSQIGTLATPTKVWAATHACPSGASPGPTYPLLCTSGAQPISGGNSNTHIYGEVKGNSIGSWSDSRYTNPGIVLPTSGVPATGLPPFDRTAIKNAVNASGQTLTAAQASDCPGGVENWPANVKITGNIDLPNGCTITVNGDVWLTGNFDDGTSSNNAIIKPANALSSQVTIMIDGSGGFRPGNNWVLAANPLGVGFKVVTTWADAACSPDCTALNGNDLKNSEGDLTINLSNGFSGASGTTFYARWTKVRLANNGTVGSLVGQTVELSNNGNLSFNGSSGGGIPQWDVRYYEPIFD